MKLLYSLAACVIANAIFISAYSQSNSVAPHKYTEKKLLVNNAPIIVGVCEIKIIVLANGTFGYDIYKNQKLFIHQTTIPALAGNKGFATKTDAEKVARLVADKINNNQMPPSVTAIEVNDLVKLPQIKSN